MLTTPSLRETKIQFFGVRWKRARRMKGGGACQAVNGCKRCDANPLPNAYLYLAFQPPILRVVYAPPSSGTFHSGRYPASNTRPIISCPFPQSARQLPNEVHDLPLPRGCVWIRRRLQRDYRRKSQLHRPEQQGVHTRLSRTGLGRRGLVLRRDKLVRSQTLNFAPCTLPEP